MLEHGVGVVQALHFRLGVLPRAVAFGCEVLLQLVDVVVGMAAADSRKEGTNQSCSSIAAMAPTCAASWPETGAKVPMRPWRCICSMCSSKRRANA
jgi:hypothetical protein